MEQYIRKDCESGILTNSDEIKYYKATQRVEIISNFMLGDYNYKGEYIIDESISDELLRMPKSVTNTFHNMIFCSSLVVTEFVEQEKFVVKTTSDETNPKIKISTLEVMENVSKAEGYIVNTITTPIAQFVDVDSEHYYEKMFQAFNIFDANDFQQEELDKFARGIVSLRRKYVVALNHLCENKMMEADKLAYMKKMELLKKSGTIGAEAIKSFEDRLRKNPLIASKNNYKALNELLDSVIETHQEKLEPIMPKIQQIGVEYAERIENIEKYANQNLINLQKTEAGRNAIKTQQANVAKNEVANNQTVKNIVTQEAINEKYKSPNPEQVILQEVEVKETAPKSKNGILKAIIGSVLPENKKKVKEANKQPKENSSLKKENSETKPSTNNKPENIKKVKKVELKENNNRNTEKKGPDSNSKKQKSESRTSNQNTSAPLPKSQETKKTESITKQQKNSPAENIGGNIPDKKVVNESRDAVVTESYSSIFDRKQTRVQTETQSNKPFIEQETIKKDELNIPSKNTDSKPQINHSETLNNTLNEKQTPIKTSNSNQPSFNEEKIKPNTESIVKPIKVNVVENESTLNNSTEKNKNEQSVDYFALLNEFEKEGDIKVSQDALNETFYANISETSVNALNETLNANISETRVNAIEEATESIIVRSELNAIKEGKIPKPTETKIDKDDEYGIN